MRSPQSNKVTSKTHHKGVLWGAVIFWGPFKREGGCMILNFKGLWVLRIILVKKLWIILVLDYGVGWNVHNVHFVQFYTIFWCTVDGRRINQQPVHNNNGEAASVSKQLNWGKWTIWVSANLKKNLFRHIKKLKNIVY